MNRRVAVVILNYNGAEMLAGFLPLVQEFSPEADVVVADNASTDNSVELVRSKFPDVTLIALDRNYGFADGYNKALEQVDAEYYILLNSDVEVTPGWIAPLLSFMDARREVVACQPKVLDYKDKVVCCSGMLQKEVAERLAAGPGTKTRGILSVLLQAWYNVEYLFTVNENVFNPPPKVKSGVVKLVRNTVTDLGCDERLFKTVVKTSFGQRRKTLRNSLRGLLPPEATIPDDPIFTRRPEQLSVEEFIYLTNLVASIRG